MPKFTKILLIEDCDENFDLEYWDSGPSHADIFGASLIVTEHGKVLKNRYADTRILDKLSKSRPKQKSRYRSIFDD